MIEELKDAVRRLNQLLDDPHEGTYSWTLAVGQIVREIAAYAPPPEWSGLRNTALDFVNFCDNSWTSDSMEHFAKRFKAVLDG